MIKHIVLWKMKPQDAAANMRLMRERLLALKGVVPGIVEMVCGPDFVQSAVSYDFALICTLKDSKALAIYNDHPEHVKVKQFIGQVTDTRVVADFEI